MYMLNKQPFPFACQVHKFYQALVLGHPPLTWDGSGARLCDRLRDVPGRFARSVAFGAEGQAAETTVKVLQRGQWPKALGEFSFGERFSGSSFFFVGAQFFFGI